MADGRQDSAGDVNDGVTTSRPRRRVVIDRPVFDQSSFDRTFIGDDDDSKPASATASASLRRLKQLLTRTCGCDDGNRSRPRRGRRSSACGGVARKALGFLPVVKHLRDYSWRQWLISDVVSGISTGVVHVPQVNIVIISSSSKLSNKLHFCFSSPRHGAQIVRCENTMKS
jgi:hypothetical protein